MREWNPFFCSQFWAVLVVVVDVMVVGLIICGGNPDDAAAVANNWGGPEGCHC